METRFQAEHKPPRCPQAEHFLDTWNTGRPAISSYSLDRDQTSCPPWSSQGATDFLDFLCPQLKRAGNAAIEAPIGLKEGELTEYLQNDLRVDARQPRGSKQRSQQSLVLLKWWDEVSQYGQNGAKTLKEFSEQLIKGEVHIVKGKQLGKILGLGHLN